MARFLFVLVAAFLMTPSPAAAQKNDPIASAIEILRADGALKQAPPIKVVSLEEVSHLSAAGVGAHLRGFQATVDGVRDPTVYIIRDNELYKMASSGNGLAVILLAGTILHEQTHADGGDEKTCLTAEIKFLRRQQRHLPARAVLVLSEFVGQLERRLTSLN